MQPHHEQPWNWYDSGVISFAAYMHFGMDLQIMPYNGEVEGINMDQCRAIATAVFGDPAKVEPVIVIGADRLPMLANGTIVVLANTATHTMGRDVFDKQSDTGFTFSTPYCYSGMVFAGRPSMVDCAENFGDATSNNGTCSELKVCAPFGSTHYFTALKLFPSSVVVPGTSIEQIAERMADGTCNVTAVEIVGVDEKRLNDYGYEGPFKAGTMLFSKEPLALVTREDDPEWSSLVDIIVNIFFLAEANNITKNNAASMASFFEDDDPVMAAHAVAIVSNFGNYDDLYRRHIQEIVPRGGLNTIYSTSSSMENVGLLHSHPVGLLGAKGPGPRPGMTLEKILVRGHLRCGVIPRSGFAAQPEDGDDGDWSGFDVQFCRGVSAALFGEEAVVLVNVGGDSGQAYSALARGEVDLVAGSRVTLQAKYRERTTGKGYTFSPPTFYDNEAEDAFALATNQDDTQWSDFVYWVVSGLIYADEMGISQTEWDEMPETKLFGEGLEQMLQHAVKAVGSYGEIYNQTLQKTIPRSGRNLLQMQNGKMEGPQQYAIPAF